jgi:hypothetical protein
MKKIERLERIVERNAEWRKAERQKAETEEARLECQRQTLAAPIRKRMEFWCRRCELDFEAVGRKALCGFGRSRYDARCPNCGAKCLRRITETAGDPYFRQSEKLRVLREAMGDDLLQPGDPRWEKVYGKKIRDRESYDKEGLERVQWERSRNRT